MTRTLVFLAFTFAACAVAQRARTAIVAVDPKSGDAKAILITQAAYLKNDPALSKVSFDLSPVLIKRNDKYAYLVARVSRSRPLPPPFAKDPFLDAVLEWKNGHWESSGYQAGKPNNGGSVADMCGYGAGLRPDVFKECRAVR